MQQITAPAKGLSMVAAVGSLPPVVGGVIDDLFYAHFVQSNNPKLIPHAMLRVEAFF